MVSDRIDPNWPPPAYEPTDDIDTTPPPAESPLGRIRWVVGAVVVLVCVAAVAVVMFTGKDRGRPGANPTSPATTAASPPATTSTAANTAPCGPDQATAVSAALAKIPPDTKTGQPWNPTPESSNYGPCDDLSAVVVTVQDATRSSPDQALMFHRGTFVGTATPKAYPFTKIEEPASTVDLVVLTYRSRQSCDTCDDGTLTTVGFEWQGDHVQVLDPLPQTVDSPP
ncbi:Putative lipoprotein LprE [Mycobacterium simulans]|nr:Putative lipoprotein LprE [Mycobacterium simulans]